MLDAAKVCDYFALAHAHDDAGLTTACATLAAKGMFAVSQTEGFKRLSAEKPLLLAALIKSMGEVQFGQEMRKKKRKLLLAAPCRKKKKTPVDATSTKSIAPHQMWMAISLSALNTHRRLKVRLSKGFRKVKSNNSR